ncbi:MAG TPA: response regulator [Candidatus Sulfotelmatobacter sp.]|nr:response regulator [Candidatus Sulfotelmatobacter sp.]
MVDDTSANLLALEAVLDGPDYDLIRAHSGSEALEVLSRHPDVALILLDVQMPIMDGFETARRIKNNPAYSAIPIIFITAVYTTDPFVREGLRAGGVDYFTKPFDPEVLKLKVNIYTSFRQKTELLRERERQIRESEDVLRVGRKLASMLESLPVGIVIADALAHIGQANEEVLKILRSADATHVDAYGEFLNWWQKGGAVLRGPDGPLMRALAGQPTYKEEVLVTCLDGAKQHIFIDASPLRNVEGNIVGAVLVLQDVTERRKIKADFEERIMRLVSAGIELEQTAYR